VIRDTYASTGTLVHEPSQGARLTLRSFTKTDDDGNAWKYASVSYGDGTEYSDYILEQALMYVAAKQVYATACMGPCDRPEVEERWYRGL